VDLAKSLVVINRKSVEPFSREKLLISIYDSLRHRKTAVNDATGLSSTVISRLYSLSHEAQIKREDIINTTIAVLRRFDKVAATHYTAFHPAKL
jgi:transcriptional regulator NrdR family protein